jgi:hypothetical protein
VQDQSDKFEPVEASDVAFFFIVIVMTIFLPILSAFLNSYHSLKPVDVEKEIRDRLLMLIPLTMLVFHYKATTKLWILASSDSESENKIPISTASRPFQTSLFLQLPFFHQTIFEALTPAERLTFVALGTEVKRHSKFDLLARPLFVSPFIILPLSIVSVLESTVPANMVLIVLCVNLTLFMIGHLCAHFSSQGLTKAALQRIKDHPDEAESMLRIFEVIHQHPNHVLPGIPKLRKWESKLAFDHVQGAIKKFQCEQSI